MSSLIGKFITMSGKYFISSHSYNYFLVVGDLQISDVIWVKGSHLMVQIKNSGAKLC